MRQKNKVIDKEQKQNLRRRKNKEHLFAQKRKAIEFGWNVQRILQHLQNTSYDFQSSTNLIDEVLEDPTSNNIGCLIQIVTQTDIKLKMAFAQKVGAILTMIQNKLETPEGIVLLANLCAIFDEYLEETYQRQLVSRITSIMYELRHDLKSAAMYSWALCQLTRQRKFNDQTTLKQALPKIYLSLCECPQNYPHFQNLIRAISYFSKCICFPNDFIKFLIDKLNPNKLSNIVNRVNVFITVVTQITCMKNESDVEYSLMIYEFVMKEYPGFPEQIKNQHQSIYMTIKNLIEKSEGQLADKILQTMPEIVKEYKYLNMGYLKMLQSLIMKACVTNEMLNILMFQTSVIQNLINDINDPNHHIGFQCLKVIDHVVHYFLNGGLMEELEWMLGLDLKENIQSLADQVPKESEISNLCMKILDNISLY